MTKGDMLASPPTFAGRRDIDAMRVTGCQCSRSGATLAKDGSKGLQCESV